MPTTPQIETMYRRIFEGIPPNFLDPAHPNNQAVIGAIGYSVAYAEELYQALEDGLFFDTADGETIAGFDGLAGLDRLANAFGAPRAVGETDEQLKARIAQRLYGPRGTRLAIMAGVAAATGRTTTVTALEGTIARMNDGPWRGKFLVGDYHGYGSLLIETEAAQGDPDGTVSPAGVVAAVMPFLRFAGQHWRHREVARYQAPGLEVATSSRNAFTSRGGGPVFFPGFRPNHPLDPDAYPMRERRDWISSACVSTSSRRFRFAGSMLLEGETSEVLAENTPSDLPGMGWDDPTTPWDESSWSD